MSFLLLMSVIGSVIYALLIAQNKRHDWRGALRIGAGGAFLLTGVDHLVSQTRYVEMIPPYLAHWDVELVIASGCLEMAAAVALLLPSWIWVRLRLPNLRSVAGVGLAMLLSVMVVANGHVAESGSQVQGLDFGTSYFAFRPFFQPFIVLWVLLGSEAIFPISQGPRQ
jgi:uncharacterized membrane protein